MPTLDETALFVTLGKIIESAFDVLRQASLHDRFIELQALLAALITVSIMYKGYLTLAGKSQEPIRELIFDIARKMFILSFVLNVNGWLNLAIDALNGIYEWAGGGIVFYERLDKIAISFIEAISKVWGTFSLLKNPIATVFSCLAMLISFCMLIFTFAFSIIKASIVNTLLIITLPLALAFFMFERTKQAFSQWLNLFLSNVIVLILFSCFIDFMCKTIANLYAPANMTNSNLWISILYPLLITAILVTIIHTIKEIARALASVSLDDSNQFANTMGRFGASAGAMGNLGKRAGSAAVAAGAFGIRNAPRIAAGASNAANALASTSVAKQAAGATKKLWAQMRN